MIKYLLLTALLLFLGGANGAPAASYLYGGTFESAEEQKAVYAADEALELRNFDEAYQLARAAAQAFPRSLEAHRTLASAAVETYRLRGLLEEYAPLLEGTDQERLRALYIRGWAATLVGDMRLGLQELTAARELAPEPDFELERAWLVARRMSPSANPQQVQQEYEAFLRRFGSIGLAHVSYLNFFNFHGYGEGEHREAARRALEISDGHPRLYIALERLRREHEFWYDPAEGLQFIEEGLEKFPGSTHLALRRLELLRALGRTEQALAYVRQWRRAAPNHGDFRVVEVELLADLTRWDEAIAAQARFNEMKYQNSYVERAPYRLAELQHYAGRSDEAVETLTEALVEQRLGGWARSAQLLLTRLQARQPGDRVHILPVGYLQQRGNYCGPATVSMILRFMGRGASQEEIADSVYTGVAGTPPQVLHNFARMMGLESVEFPSDPALWKELLDRGHPILWLQMLGRRGGHYRVITGYDDVNDVWLANDPNDFTRREIPYDQIEDTWILPTVGRSLIFVEPDQVSDPLIASLGPTPVLLATNWAMYIATGSNLFVGIFPALPVNLAVSTLLALAIIALVRGMSYPTHGLNWLRLLLPPVVLAAALNLLIGIFRWNEAVSVLLSFHLALLTLIPLLGLMRVGRFVARDFLHPRESLGICLLAGFTWLSLAWIDQDPYEWVVPTAVFALGVPLVIWPRLRMRAAERAAARGQLEHALARLRPYGRRGAQYFSAICLEVECLLLAGRTQEAAQLAHQTVETLGHRPKESEAFLLLGVLADALDAPSEATWERAALLEGNAKARPIIRHIAGAVLIHLEAEGIAPSEQGIYAAQPERADTLLAALDHAQEGGLPGLTPARRLHIRPILRVALLMSLTAALKLSADNPTRQKALFERWSARTWLYTRFATEWALGRPDTSPCEIPLQEELAAK